MPMLHKGKFEIVLVNVKTQFFGETYLKSFVIDNLSPDENFPDEQLCDVRKNNLNDFQTSFEDFKRSFSPKLMEHFGIVNQG